MNNNNKLPKQAKPQEFELVELLFREYISSHIARPDIEYSFQARFQSFIDQIPSYLHSSSKLGFFTHFFFGSFATLLDTKLAKQLEIKKLHFNFDRVDHLRIVAETDTKTHIFIFTENNHHKKQKKHKDIGFTKGEWQSLKGTEYTDGDNEKLAISVIQINKSTGNIKVTIEKKDIQDNVGSTKQYNELTKQFVDKHGQYIPLEDKILKLSNSAQLEVKSAFKLILEYTKKIHDYYQDLPYGDGGREADQHGFVAGILNNFRYRENAHVYLEQFAGKGYADIVILVRGPDRSPKSIPIIIELKAGTGAGTSSDDALNQVEEYTKGFQPNNMRILSLADNILCVGMNLDSPSSFFMQMKVVKRDQAVIPVVQQIINQLVTEEIINQNPAPDDLIVIQQTIKQYLEKTYNTFPGTGEKSSAHYMSRFLLGESLVLRDYDKHIFIYDKESYIPTATVIDDHGTRSKKPKIEKIVDGSNAVNSILLISKDKDNPAIILNIIDTNRALEPKKLPLNVDIIGNRKIISLDIKFNIDQSSQEFNQYCDVELGTIYNSISEYRDVHSPRAQGSFTKIGFKDSIDLTFVLKNAIDSQNGLVISEDKYKEFFRKVAAILYPIKSLINNEPEWQGLLDGILKYYSDMKLAEGGERRELVLTEFQTGSGSRIDMLVQAIGLSEHGMKEYIPVGLELKYDNSIKLDTFEHKQDKQIQHKLLEIKAHKLLEKLLHDQTEQYAQGAAIKSITDGSKVAVMGIVFNGQAKDPDKLLLTTDQFLKASIVHSSLLYSMSNSIMVPNINDLPPPDSAYFQPDWVEQATYDTLAKMQGEDQNLLSLFNKNLDDKKIMQLHSLLKNNPNLQSIDGLDLSFNRFTATSLKRLIDILGTKLIYLDLTDNDLAQDNFTDLEEVIKDIKVPILRIADIGMNNLQMTRIIELLAVQDKVSDLGIQHLESLKMTSNLADSISTYLQDSQMLEYLDLSKTGIDNKSIIKISQGLKHSLLKTLVLRDNDISQIGVEALATALARSAISHIPLSGNPLGVYGVDALVKSVNNNSKIKQLELINVDLQYIPDQGDLSKRTKAMKSNEKLLSIMESLFSNPNLYKIDISYNDIGNSGIQRIFSTLSNHIETSNLQSLSLAGNQIDLGAHDLAITVIAELIYDYISQTRMLHSLDLSLMELSDEVAVKIVSALEKNVSLIHLDLSGNDRIDTKTISALARVLSTNKYLEYLNLADNKLNINDLSILLDGLKKNSELTHLNLSGNDFSGIITESNGRKITNLGNQDIKNLLKNNNSLKYLNLAKCQLNTELLKSLFAALKENNSLEVLDIRDHIIDNEIVDYVVEALRTNAQQGLNGLKILHISKTKLDHVAISKLTDKSLGVSVLVEDAIASEVELSEEVQQTCTVDLLSSKNLALTNEFNEPQQIFERATRLGDYHYWLQQHDIPDIARVHYGYKQGEIEIVGSIDQLSHEIEHYRNSDYIGPFTIILNIGQDGHGGSHWVSIVLNRVNNQHHAYYTDSLGNHIASNIITILNQNRILVHDISIIQQRDGHNCGLFALDNGHRISQLLLGNSNANIDDIRNSLVPSYNDHELQVLRRDIASELENDVIHQGNLINIGMLPQVIEDDQSSFAASLDCMIWAGGAYILKTKHKRSTSEVHNKILINKQFLDYCQRDSKPHMIGFELLKLIHWKQLVVDVESCDSFSKLIHSFYAALYSKIHGVDIEVLRIKIQKAFASQDISQLSRVLDNIKDLNILEIISKETFIIHSVEALNIAWTRLLIEKGANVNAQDAKGNTALYYAIKKNDKAVIKLLIEKGANLNIHNYDGDSPIHLAIKNNNTDICKLLIEKGANVNAQDAKGNTPVIIATAIKNKELVNDLIDVNAKNDDGDSAISTIVGVSSGSVVIGGGIIGLVKTIGGEAIGSIASSIASPSAIIDRASSITNRARGYSRVDNSDSEILENLIEHGANLNVGDSFGNTPLHHAAANNDVEMVEFCINNNANIDARNHLGETPLHIATNNIRYRGGRTTRDIKTDVTNSNIDTKTKKIISILVQHNANLSIQNNHDDTALHLAVKKHAIEVVELLLNAVMDGILLYIENNNGDTIVKLALISGDYKMISCFINFRDYSGSSILHLAVKNNAKEIIDLLIKNKVDLNIVDKDGYTAIHLAVASSNEELVEYLIGYKVNINIQDMRGNTPIHLSAEIRNIKIFEMLLENNANLNLKNKDNKTAIQLAKEYGMDVEQFQLPTPIPYKDHDIEDLTIRSKDLENTYYHKHRHHHGENYHREAHHNKNITAHHRGRRDIEDRLSKISEESNSDDMRVFLSDDNIVLSSSSSLKPLGYNIVNWLRDKLNSLNLNPITQVKNWFNVDDAKEQSRIDWDFVDNLSYQDNNLCELNADYANGRKLLGLGYKVEQSSSRLIGDEESSIINGINSNLLDKQGNLLLFDLLLRKQTGVKYNKEAILVSNNDEYSKYANSLAYSSYASVEENQEEPELLGVA